VGNAPLVDLDSGPARGFEGHTVVAGCRAIVVVEEERHLDGGDAAGVRIEDGRKPQSDRGSGGLGEVQARRGSRSGSEGKSIQPNGPKAISYRNRNKKGWILWRCCACSTRDRGNVDLASYALAGEKAGDLEPKPKALLQQWFADQGWCESPDEDELPRIRKPGVKDGSQ